jgi:hypothetical protein
MVQRRMSDDDRTPLGTCCGCGGTEAISSIYMLPFRNKVPGHGWGCVVCHLPSDGASAVLCDSCATLAEQRGIEAVLRFACRGYPGTDGRADIAKFTEPFAHDESIEH